MKVQRMTFDLRMRPQRWSIHRIFKTHNGRMRRRPMPSPSMGMRLFVATRWPKVVRQMAQQMRP